MKFLLIRCLALVLIFFSLLPLRSDAAPETQHNRPDIATQAEEKKNKRWGRDPFYRDRPTTNNELHVIPHTKVEVEAAIEEEEPEPKIDLSLSAIIFRDGDGVAIINDRIVRRGDIIGEDFIVSQVLSNKVFLLKGKRTVVLQVQEFGSN